jgi:hypothetical protein
LVNGNGTASGAYGRFISDSLAAPVAFAAHTLTLYGNLSTGAGVDSSGSIIFRMGSTNATATLNTAQGCNVTFAGTANSVITLQKTVYTPTYEMFNGTVINKTGGAKVILSGGNLFQNTNSSTGSAYLIFTSGMVETGPNNIWAVLVTAAAGLNTANSTMYVNGNLGRGITSSGGQRIFDVGDANGYRPIRIYPVAVTYAHTWLFAQFLEMRIPAPVHLREGSTKCLLCAIIRSRITRDSAQRRHFLIPTAICTTELMTALLSAIPT